MSPDGSTKPSPEERLLRLIRARAPKPATAAVATGGGMAMPVVRRAPVSWAVVAAWSLMAVLVGELGYLAFQAMQPLPIIEVPMVTPNHLTAGNGTGGGDASVEVPSLTESASHPLFVSSAAAGPAIAPPTVTPKSGPSDLAKKLSGRLTLAGIVDGQPPQAIITDSETSKTYFVNPGQTVVDGATLEQVLDNRVILDLNGEKIELSL